MQINIDTRKFEKELEKAGKNIEKTINQTIKKTAFEAESDIKAVTPVDTGRARADWKTTQAKDKYILSNNVPYIERLNTGSSKQAPANFVQITLNKIINKLKRIFEW